MICVGVGDHTKYLVNQEGFNVYKLKEHVSEKNISEYEGGQEISADDFFKIKCNVLIPAACELVILKDRAENLNCDLIAYSGKWPS